MRKRPGFMTVLFRAAIPLVPPAFAGRTAGSQQLIVSYSISSGSPWQKASFKFAEIIHPKTGGEFGVEEGVLI